MRKRKEQQLPDWDDGRTIVDMNVDGMDQFAPIRLPKKPMEPRAKEKPNSDGLTRSQTRMYTFSALKAGLLVAAVMSVFLILFTLFCLHVWLRV